MVPGSTGGVVSEQMDVSIDKQQFGRIDIAIGTCKDNSWGGYLDHDDVRVMYGENSMWVEMVSFYFRVRLPRSFGTDAEWKDPKWVIETVWLSLRGYLQEDQFAQVMQDLMGRAVEATAKKFKAEGINETQFAMREALGLRDPVIKCAYSDD